MMRCFKDKIVLVTGAASGIGYETCLAFAREGAQIIATDISLEALKGLVAKLETIQSKHHVFTLDVSDASQFSNLAEQLIAQGLLPDVLVNNAGIAFLGSFMEQTADIWTRIFNVNLMGVVNGCHAFIPALKAVGDERLIINIASLASIAPAPNMSAYAASKSAVHGLSDVLAMELADSRVSVLCVHPGIINTNIVRTPNTTGVSISDAQLDTLQRYYTDSGCTPDVVAADIVIAAKEGKARLFTGPLAKPTSLVKRVLSTERFRKLLLSSARKVGYLPAK